MPPSPVPRPSIHPPTHAPPAGVHPVRVWLSFTASHLCSEKHHQRALPLKKKINRCRVRCVGVAPRADMFTALLLRRNYLLWRCALVCERLRCEPWRPWGWGDSHTTDKAQATATFLRSRRPRHNQRRVFSGEFTAPVPVPVPVGLWFSESHERHDARTSLYYP